MSDIKFLTRENIPCWYELSWRKTKPAIILRVHKDFIKNTDSIRDEVPIVVSLKEEFKFASFVGNFDGNFGFDNAFIRRGEKEEFVEFVVEIPRIKDYTGKCKRCNGTGEDKELSMHCIHCGGEGKEYEFNWKLAYTISANFTVFSTFLRFPEKETSSSLIQLMTVQTITQQSSHGGSLGGDFSVPLCSWMDSLREKEESDIVEMVEAMQTVYRVMFGRLKPYRKWDFRAWVAYEGGWLNTSCPGDACGLHPQHMGPEKGQGYQFECHNVDNPMQQLTLIASLAALHDKARKEMKI